jgi:hypothetical protein
MQRFARSRFLDARDVTWAGNRRAQNGVIVSYGARSFAAAAVDAQIESHGIVLSQRF